MEQIHLEVKMIEDPSDMIGNRLSKEINKTKIKDIIRKARASRHIPKRMPDDLPF